MRIFLLVLILFPTICFGAFTEFYITSGGSNLNAGSTSGNSAVYTSTGGNWANTTRVFTPTDGSNPSSSVSVGDFASVYVTAGATATGFVGRVTAVQNATNGTITIASTFAGVNPSNGTGTITLKTGGAWSGNNGTVTFPFSLSNLNNLVNTSANNPRFNFKNDQTYSMTATLTMTLQATTVQGYSSSVGDGGKATFTSNVTSGTNFAVGGTAGLCIDMIFVSTGTSGTNTLVSATVAGNSFIRCIFHGARGDGLFISATGLVFECEAYDCNKSNTVSKGGFDVGAAGVVMLNCYSHDHSAGNNANGFVASGSTVVSSFINCIADTVGGAGFYLNESTGGGNVLVNCDAYNNTGDGIKNVDASSPNSVMLVQNCNLLKNGGKGINIATTGTTPDVPGFSYNNGYGAGTQANGSSDTLSNLTEVNKLTYPSNVTPWNAPTTGDFTLVSTNTHAGYNTGRSHFEETDGTNTGTVGYPDIGSAQHNDSCSGTGPCQTSGASAY